MENIQNILDKETIEEIAREAGDGVTAKEVTDVLNAVLPEILQNAESGQIAQRAAETPVERGGMLNVLPLLLGANSANSAAAAAQSTGVSAGSTSSILKIAAPILLLLLLKNAGGQQQQPSGLGLLGSLMGAQQPVQQQPSGLGLLGSLLGAQQPVQQPVQQNAGLLNLLGAQPVQQQPIQQQNTANLLQLLSGAQPQAAQQSQSSLLNLLGAQPVQQQPVQQVKPQSAGGGLLGALFSLLGDDGN